VPIYIRTGKCLAATATEVFVTLKRPPFPIFAEVPRAPGNHVRFRLSPDVVIELGARAKRPGDAMTGEAVDLDASRSTTNLIPPYQRLLGDAMRGDQMLFGRNDSVIEAWRIVQPVLGGDTPIFDYESGSWGPSEADAFIPEGKWHNPVR
jgi:glucose-6-phosphate 1-dehydrogenase